MHPDVVVSEFIAEETLDPLRASFAVLYEPALYHDTERLLAVLRSARAIIVRNQTKVGVQLLDTAPRLEVVGRLGVGLDNIDLAACSERGIAVHPATGSNAIAVAEYVIGALFVLLRRAYSATDEVIAGSWPRSELVGSELSGKLLGLIGFGEIAREVATRARALGMDVHAHDPFIPPDDDAWKLAARTRFDTLIEESDAISVHVPLTAETRGLIDGSVLSSMKPSALLVNTSRGGIVDEDALITALRSDLIGGAALDVFGTEPVSAAQGERFADLPNVLLTPHIAGITRESGVRVGQMTVAAVLATLGVPA